MLTLSQMHTNNSTQHTPTPWRLSEQYSLTVEYKIGDYIATMCGLRDKAEANAAFIVRACNAHDELVAALSGLLEQATGPTEVYGDGIGKDGTKTGLSHWEFNQLRDERIAKARAVLAKL